MSDSADPELPNPLLGKRNFSFLPCPSIRFTGDRPTADIRNHDSQFGSSDAGCVDSAESVAVERLVELKQKLRSSDSEPFWDQLMGDLTSICNAQFGFVVRKVRAEERPREMRECWHCLLGMVFYYNDGYQHVGMQKNRYLIGGNPLSHMDYNKPCLIPEGLGSFSQTEIDQLPFAPEAYLSIPLFSRGKCLAHLGLMWSEEGLRKRNLAWLSLEMTLYSLEDLVVQRILSDSNSAKADLQGEGCELDSLDQKAVRDSPSIQSNELSEGSIQPFKPYARSLSHELRTPMQGVVGMLDVMHATVREAIESKSAAKTSDVFQSLKESIEMVQDSARRAVEAADNVVHAYDLNMQVPETPQKELADGILIGSVPFSTTTTTTHEHRPNILVEGSNITVNPCKRRRSYPERNVGPPYKQRILRMPSEKQCSPRSQEVKDAVHESERIMEATPAGQIEEAITNMVNPRPSLAVRRSAPHLLLEGLTIRDPALRFTQLRDLLRLVIDESLHVGGRPDFAVSQKTEFGEKIEVRSRLSNGQISAKVIDWSVDPAFPDTFLVDNRDLAKLISCVFLNAVKFTNTGTVTVYATVSPKANNVLITIRDTGSGIPEAFLPNLFKPFARGDTSTTQSKDGLGLGLLVAKGLARKMGGDLVCVRSSTSGPDRGTEFEIRLPVNQFEACSSNPSTPATRIITPSYIDDQSRLDRTSNSSNGPSVQSHSPSGSLSQRVQQPSLSLTDESISPATSTSSSHSVSTLTQGRMPTVNGDAFDSKLGEKYPLTFLVAEDNRINRRVLVTMLKKLGYHDVYEACDGKEAVRIMQDMLTLHYSESASASSSGDIPSQVDADGDKGPAGDLHHHSPDRHKKRRNPKPIDVVLMDLWMPEMDGYQATARIFELIDESHTRFSSHDPQNGPHESSQHPLNDITEKEGNLHSHPYSNPHPISPPPPPPTVLAVSADVTDEALSRAARVGIKGYMTKPYKLSDLERLIVEFCGDGGGGGYDGGGCTALTPSTLLGESSGGINNDEGRTNLQ